MAELTLPQRIRDAAAILEELGSLYGYPSPQWARWDADEIRKEAAVLETDEPRTREEQWRQVVGYEGLYEVSSYGRVRSVDRVIVTYQGWSTRRPGRVLRQFRARGHSAVSLSAVGRKQRVGRVHVLVLEAFVGPRPRGMEGCHNDGDPYNNHVSNLRWDTPAENAADRRKHGRDHELNKTHCPQGHEYTPENTYVYPKSSKHAGNRKCKACGSATSSARASAQYAARRAAGIPARKRKNREIPN